MVIKLQGTQKIIKSNNTLNLNNNELKREKIVKPALFKEENCLFITKKLQKTFK